mmetsp:Transcript_53099/g.137328  ORF Transcript_53099/g.137328 Transcript_53099/m.137328 type:complete len:102 (+) Transcript_53099:442-747(+)
MQACCSHDALHPVIDAPFTNSLPYSYRIMYAFLHQSNSETGPSFVKVHRHHKIIAHGTQFAACVSFPSTHATLLIALQPQYTENRRLSTYASPPPGRLSFS